MEHQVDCLVHGKKYRAEFQFVLNFLRGKVSDKSLNFGFASSVVCCCKSKATEEKNQSCDIRHEKASIEDSELKNAMESVLVMENIPEKVKNVLKKWKNRAQDVDGLVLYGNSRIAGLMLLCLKGNYKLLQNPVSGTTVQGRQVTLPINPSLLGVYFGRKGRGVKDLCEKYNCLIRAGAKSASVSLTVTETIVTVICKDEQFEEVQKLLIAKAKELLTEKHANKIAMSLVRGRTE